MLGQRRGCARRDDVGDGSRRGHLREGGRDVGGNGIAVQWHGDSHGRNGSSGTRDRAPCPLADVGGQVARRLVASRHYLSVVVHDDDARHGVGEIHTQSQLTHNWRQSLCA